MRFWRQANLFRRPGWLPRFAVVLAALLLSGASASAQEFEIEWFVVGGGGGVSADDVYEVSGTAGQHDAGELAEAEFAVQGGFWAAFDAVPPIVPGEPTLTIEFTGADLIISWPAPSTGYVLEQNPSTANPNGWTAVAAPVVIVNGRNTVTMPAPAAMTLFRLTQNPTPPPRFLTIAGDGPNVIVSWPVTSTNFVLEQNPSLKQPCSWSKVSQPVVEVNGRNTVTMPATADSAFFRLTPVPTLTITISGGQLVISWPAPSTGYRLEQNTQFDNPNSWTPVTEPVVPVNGYNVVTVPIGSVLTIYRLTESPLLQDTFLTISLADGNVVVSWPETTNQYSLEQNPNLDNPATWTPVNDPVSAINDRLTVVLPVTGNQLFYRLVPAPTLSFTLTEAGMVLSWADNPSYYVLEENSKFNDPSGWTPVAVTPTIAAGRIHVTLPVAAELKIHRLTRVPPAP